MKKSTRILAILMAFVMLMGSFSVMGSAYKEYKGDAIKGQYNDVDSVDFDLEQYASMGLDEVDRMLAKEQMVLDIYIGTLDISSINTALTGVKSLVDSLSSLLGMLGDAASLPSYIAPLEGVQRYDETDLEVCYALLNFISNIAPLAEKYVTGTIDLGMMNGFISDFIFDVRTLAIGLVYGMTAEGEASDYDAMDDGENGIPAKYLNTENGAITLLQDLLNEFVLGSWVKLDEYFDDPMSDVMYEVYGFSSEYDEVQPNTAEYDYYGYYNDRSSILAAFGGCERVAEGTTTVPPAEYDVIDITGNKTGYEFIENLMQVAYNRLLVPVLNRDTRVWVRELCGVTYDPTYASKTMYNEAGEKVNNPNYDPTYDGDYNPETDATEYAKFLNPNVRVATETIPAGETFVENFNDIVGRILDSALVTPRGEATEEGYSWDWVDGSNEYLFDNVCSVGRFIIQVTGGLFFSEHVDVPTAEEAAEMSNQQIVAFIIRAILNSSVDWMYIESEYDSVAEVGYRAVEQLAWQDIPQFTYTMPKEENYGTPELYYDALVEKALDILFDVAVYNLNQGMDTVPASGSDPVNAEGLLQYGGDEGNYEDNLVQIAAWAVSEYGAILNLDFFCDDYDGEVGNLTADDVWMDLDTIIDSLIPIKGADGAWISAEIAGDGDDIVSKTFIFDYLIKPLCYLDATNFAEIFARNEKGDFAEHNGIQIIMSILENVFELLFPGVFQNTGSIDSLLDNETLGSMVGDLLRVLGTNDYTKESGEVLKAQGADILEVALPVVCMILGLSDDQEFEEMEIYLPETISATGSAPSFAVYNGSSGINTGYTDKNGKFTQDNLYTYEIVNAYVRSYDSTGSDTHALNQSSISKGTTIAGGDSVTVTLEGTRAAGNLVEFEVVYKVKVESGSYLTTSDGKTAVELSKTVYSYIGETNKDDDALESTIDCGKDISIEYNPTIYLSAGDDLDDIESYSIRVQDKEDEAAATARISAVSNSSTEYPFVAMNDDADLISVNLEGKGGLYFLSPFTVATKADGTLYERYEETTEVDEEGNETTTSSGEVKNGQYNVTTTVAVNGSNYTVPTTIHLYNDYGLGSLFDRAIASNRQESGYEGEYEGAWNNYEVALKEAARLVLMPKSGSTFLANITVDPSTGYENKYEQLATELSDAIDALEEFAADTGVDGLKNALAQYSGINYTIATDSNGNPYRVEYEYDDDNYVYFGMRDYVPHTYTKYRDARNRVEDLINSQQIFVPAPFEDGYEPTDDEIDEYIEAVAEYNEKVASMGVIDSIEATYAIHMLELAGSRLIRLEGSTDKLDMLIEKYGDAKDASVSYTADSEERYDRAVAFANEVSAESDPLPSKINEASSELVAAWKKLSVSANYSALDAAITAAAKEINTTGADASKQMTYTVTSYQAFLDAYNEAINIDRDLSASEENNAYIAEVTSNLTKAQANLERAASTEASFKITTEDPGAFWDLGWNQTFTPGVSQGALTHDYFGAMLPDGTVVDGYLVGLGEAVPDEETLLMAFSELNNINVVVTPSMPEIYGTGTLIQLYNKSTNALMATYICVVIGDLDGDSTVGTGDEPLLNDNCNGKTDWAWDGNNLEYLAAAADISNDGSADAGDNAYYNRLFAYEGYVNQNVGPEGESSFVVL